MNYQHLVVDEQRKRDELAELTTSVGAREEFIFILSVYKLTDSIETASRNATEMHCRWTSVNLGLFQVSGP